MTNPIPTIVDNTIDAFIATHGDVALGGVHGDGGAMRVVRSNANDDRNIATVVFEVTDPDDRDAAVVWFHADRETGATDIDVDTDIGVDIAPMVRTGAQRIATTYAYDLRAQVQFATSPTGQVNHALNA